MTISRRTLGAMLIGAGAIVLAGPAVVRLFALTPARVPRSAPPAQEQAPNRREFTVAAKDYRFSPNRIEVLQNDLVTLTVQSHDIAYGFTIDEYRLSKRVPAGGSTTIQFRADRVGTFVFYSNLTSDSRHAAMRGELIVRAR